MFERCVILISGGGGEIQGERREILPSFQHSEESNIRKHSKSEQQRRLRFDKSLTRLFIVDLSCKSSLAFSVLREYILVLLSNKHLDYIVPEINKVPLYHIYISILAYPLRPLQIVSWDSFIS